ncbi:MAG: PD-(D/E)XK nuclease family protein [Bacteroidaceae bacterium]|nr:PD-(D/E)XK nuclease family protein [Bacteroidaceae bacterium]
MQSFLSLVADDLLKRFGHEMRNVTLVFPSKRAGLFLTQEFAARSGNAPIWAPHYTTLNELFLSLSDHLLADPIDIVSRLYHIYIDCVREDISSEEGPQALERETLDRFWSWGEIILSDFNDIDKHLANPQKVFRHVRELGELSDNSFLSEEQRQTLMRFFGYFSTGEDSLVRRRFLRLWNAMPAIYEALRLDLLGDNLLWEGALHRDVCQRIEAEPQLLDRFPHICFVGFNVLNSVEEALMKALGNRALFYWDYDEYYVNDPQQEAGEFMRRNLQHFPSALPAECFRNLERLRRITFVSCPTDNAVARYTSRWMQEGMHPVARENAVVLCNERLLLPVLHAMPASEQAQSQAPINVTMGLPLSDTPIFTFVLALYQLLTEGWDERRQRFRPAFRQSVLNHPYAQYFDDAAIDCIPSKGSTDESLAHTISAIIKAVETVGIALGQDESPTITAQLHVESVYQAHRVLTKFLQLLSHPTRPLSVRPATLRRLLRSVLAATSIPFHGEPASGMQVMGVLETRCLDFHHLLMLSVEEDLLPRPTQLTSMIPPIVREAYGLTTPRHRIAVYAYYFYRLIQRSEQVTCVFNQNTSGIRRHEPSRFLRQLQADFPPSQLEIRQIQISSAPSTAVPLPVEVAKTPQMIAQLRQRYAPRSGHPLSPTAINAYLNCPLQFYYHYVALLSPTDEETDDIDAMQLGNLFHDCAEIIYTDLVRRHGGERCVEPEWIAPLLEPECAILRGYIDIAFDMNIRQRLSSDEEKKRFIGECLATGRQPQVEYAGQHIIVRDVLTHYLRQLLRHDLRLAPFTIIGTECDCTLECTLLHPEPVEGMQPESVEGRNPESVEGIHPEPVEGIHPEPAEGSPSKGTILVGGRIDRLDRLADGTLRVLDYKTGTQHIKNHSLDGAFARGSRHQSHTLQACLYALAVMESNGDLLSLSNGAIQGLSKGCILSQSKGCILSLSKDSPHRPRAVQPALYYVRSAHADDYSPALRFLADDATQPATTDFVPLADEFRRRLSETLSEIFSPSLSFRQTTDTDVCKRCDYALLCGRSTRR